MLWLALYLPHLPLQVFLRGAPEHALLAVADGRRIIAASPAAQRFGVRPDQAVAGARALIPGLVVRQRDPHAEQAALQDVATWALRYSPEVAIAPPATVLLEAAGSLQLFGGAAQLRRQVARECAQLGFTADSAIAPTPRAARWLARAGRRIVVTDIAGIAPALAGLPLDVLDCEPALLAMLMSIGVLGVEDCLRLPRAALARRSADSLLQALDQALGRSPDPQPAFVPPRVHRARIELPLPAADIEPLLFAVRHLFAGLAAHLGARHAGVESVELRLEHECAAATGLMLELASPTRDAMRLALLARERLARQGIAQPVCAISLKADTFLPLAGDTRPLFADHRSRASDFRTLVERLSARLGSDAVWTPSPAADHRPEHAWQRLAPGCAFPGRQFACGARPLWLLPVPLPLGCRPDQGHGNGDFRLLAGPERIESGWWAQAPETPTSRDYYLAARKDDGYLWVFKTLIPPGYWYLHGIFA